MGYIVIYDGCCNLCSSLVKALAQFDQGVRFQYVPMQDETTLARWGVTAADCEKGMILIHGDAPERRWQGSDAAEEIARLLPTGAPLVGLYRALPGVKGMGDRFYAQVRDHRYEWFGRREATYQAPYPDSTCGICHPEHQIPQAEGAES